MLPKLSHREKGNQVREWRETHVETFQKAKGLETLGTTKQPLDPETSEKFLL